MTLAFEANPSQIGAFLIVITVACNDLSEPVDTDVCASGRRWVGKQTGDEEMLPGTECVGCHIETGAPLLMAAGTVYGVVDNAEQIERDCYGIEGVEVELEGADGRLWRTTTNRAGNFYFDGQPAWLEKPYVARFRYTTADGVRIEPQMAKTFPAYGGCARCHGTSAEATPELAPTDVEYVVPVRGLFVQ